MTDSIENNTLKNRSITRSSRQTEMYETFGVSAYAYADDFTGNEIPNFMYNVKFEKKSESSWVSTPSYFWPSENFHMKFTAYAPYNTKDSDPYVISPLNQPGEQTLACTIPDDVNKQTDLLVANMSIPSDQRNKTTNPLLKFNHALTAIKFIAGNDIRTGKIIDISLVGIHDKGTYSLESGQWILKDSKTKTFTQKLNKEVVPGGIITTEAQTFMMLPQELSADAKIVIHFFNEADNTTYELSSSIAGNIWPQGKTVTYKLSTSRLNWEYVVEAENTDFQYSGTKEGKIKVKVYKKNYSNPKTIIPVSWELMEETPTWLHINPGIKGNGGNTGEIIPIVVDAQISTTISDPKTELKNATPKGTEQNPFNLSNVSGDPDIMNTANCYVIDAPGYYSLPLIYGNAIMNGQQNKAAYLSNYVGPYALPCFKNHLNNDITSPYIYRNAGCTPNSVKLIWQDVYPLISDIKLDKENQRLCFKIESTDISPGNAVVAVCDADNNIMWSWHIWITNLDIQNTVTFGNEIDKYEVMPCYLGWSSLSGTQMYSGRSSTLKIKLENSIIKEIPITQLPHQHSGNGKSTYYQWGRKDPLVTSGNNDFPNRIVYDVNGNELPTVVDGLNTPSLFAGMIKNPRVFSYNYFLTGYANNFANLWNSHRNFSAKLLWMEAGKLPWHGYTEKRQPYIKTIYDPSPVGFCVSEPSILKSPVNVTLTDGENKYVEIQGSNGNVLTLFEMGNCYAGTAGINFTKNDFSFLTSVGFSYRAGGIQNFAYYGYPWTAEKNLAKKNHFTSKNTAFPLILVKDNPVLVPSLWKDHLEVSVPTISYKGKDNAVVSIKSYTEYSSNKKPIPWIAEFYNEMTGQWQTSSPVDWMTINTTDGTASGNGSVSQSESFKISISKLEEKEAIIIDQNKKLSITGSLGSDTRPWNLSNTQGESEIQNTANCYIVNAPGVYSIPLIYGNAIRNGANNTAAYSGVKFVNHLNNQIIAPEIRENTGCTPSKAELLWQDAPELINSVSLSSDSTKIIFKVNQADIKQGNAVIAVYDNQDIPQIMWSWHIWFTAMDLKNTLPVKNSMNTRTYQFMPVNLGWCSEQVDKIYKGRELKMRINNKEYIIKQSGQVIQSINGESTHFQYGRKDPFPGILLNNSMPNGKKKPVYNINGELIVNLPIYDTKMNNIPKSILNPQELATTFVSNGSWYNSVKTIYDPCPYGFKVGPKDAFSAFNTSLSNKPQSFKVEASYTYKADNGIRGFECTIDGLVVFMPVSGRYLRNYGGPEGRLNKGFYLYNSSIDNLYLWGLSEKQIDIRPIPLNNSPSNGACIRPILEE